MATITIRRYVEGANAGTVIKVDGYVKEKMTDLLGGRYNIISSKIRKYNDDNTYKYEPLYKLFDLNKASESIKKYGHKVTILEPDEEL